MKTKHSLRQRIIVAFAIFSILSSLLFGLVMSLAAIRVEDYLFNQRLAQELKYCQQALMETGTLPEPTIPLIKIYTDESELPDVVRSKMTTLPLGLHELTAEDLHIAIAQQPVTNEMLYLIYDVSTLEIKLRRDAFHIAIIISISLLFGVMGFGIALVVSRRIIQPVTDLANLVQTATPDTIPKNFSAAFPDDEVGSLARKCEDFLHRIQAHVLREQQFTRFASHELRSPVTVIKGAIELLEMNGSVSDKSSKPLNRIKRAVVEMEDTINCFLLLSREDMGSLETDAVTVQTMVGELIDQHQWMIQKRGIRVVNNVDPELKIITHRQVLRLVFNNLFRNACQFTSNGTVTFDSTDQSISVTDTGTGISSTLLETATEPFVKSEKSSGHGLGLAIVDMICKRYGWKFNLSSKSNQGTCATITLIDHL